MRLTLLSLTMLAVLPLVLLTLAPTQHGPHADPGNPQSVAAHPSPLRELAKQYAASFPANPIPDGLDARQRADFLLNHRTVQGRTPAQWLDLAHQYRADPPANAPPATARLDAAALQLYQAAGVVPSPQDLAASLRSTASVPLPLQGALADLVGTVAHAYAEQEVVAHAVAQRVADGQGLRPDATILQPAERDAMAERAGRIVDAINLFHARLDALGPAAALIPGTPTCLAPIVNVNGDCLAYLGSNGDDTYLPNPAPLPDPILIVDPAGNDVYKDAAGGANPLVTGGVVPGNGLALSVVADLAGDDHYTYVGAPSVVQGAGYAGGLGILLDYAGNDHYLSNFTRAGPPGLTNVGFALNDDGGAQGYGNGGLGLLLDDWGNDRYDSRVRSTSGDCIFGYAQGWGGHGGLGIASDLWGNDTWIGTGASTASFAATGCFVGVYNQGSAIYGGIGILTDTGKGRDAYLDYDNSTATDYYAQGFSAFGGLGFLYDDGGDDTYVSEDHATSATVNPALNCAFGTASAGGTGILVDDAGNDTYYATTTSDKGAVTMVEGAGDVEGAYGLFIDRAGTDRHEAHASGSGVVGVYGRGVLDTTNLAYNVAGTFLDLGGSTQDTYIPIITSLGGSADNGHQWLFGLDDA